MESVVAGGCPMVLTAVAAGFGEYCGLVTLLNARFRYYYISLYDTARTL